MHCAELHVQCMHSAVWPAVNIDFSCEMKVVVYNNNHNDNDNNDTGNYYYSVNSL